MIALSNADRTERLSGIFHTERKGKGYTPTGDYTGNDGQPFATIRITCVAKAVQTCLRLFRADRSMV